MQFFKKNESLIKNISFMALMAAINVVFSLLTNFYPFLSVALVIFLPLTSAFVEVSCKDKYFPIYAFSTIGLSLIISISTISFTIFYIIPSIITGYIFGLMFKKGIPKSIAIFLCSVCQMIIELLFIPLIQLLTDHNIIEDFISILNIDKSFNINIYVLLIFFLYGFVQSILSFIVINNEFSKLYIPQENFHSYNPNLITSIFCILIILFTLIYLPISYLCLGFAGYFTCFEIYEHAKKVNKILLICDGVALIFSFFIYAGFNQILSNEYVLLLFGTFPLLISLLSEIFSFLQKKKCKIE